MVSLATVTGRYYKAPVSLGTMVVGDSSEGQKEYILGVLAPDLSDYTISPMSLNSTLVALKYSLEKWLQLFPEYYFTLVSTDSRCDSTATAKGSLTMQSDYEVNGFFGPMCWESCEWMISLARARFLDSMTVGCPGSASVQSTTTRLMPPYKYDSSSTKDKDNPDFFYTVNKLFGHFDWGVDWPVIYTNEQDMNGHNDQYHLSIEAFVRGWQKKNNGLMEDTFKLGISHGSDGKANLNLDMTHQQLKRIFWTRVIVISIRPDLLRQFMHEIFCVRKHDMEIKEYAVLYLHPSYEIGNNIWNQLWRDPDLILEDSRNVCLKYVFRHVMIFKQQDVFEGDQTKYEQVRDNFRAACDASSFENCRLPETPSYLQYVAATHDSVGILLEYLINKNPALSNQTNTVYYKSLFGYISSAHSVNVDSFAGASSIYFNSAGERVVKMNVWRMENTETGNFSVHITFNLDGTNSTKGPGVPWIGGEAPRDSPLAGCSGAPNTSSPNYMGVILIIMAIAMVSQVCVLSLFLYVYRTIKMRSVVTFSELKNSLDADD